MKPEWQEINPSYTKESGVWVLRFEHIPIPKTFTVVDRALVHIPPGVSAGNHKHVRAELFVGLGEDVVFSWLDEKGETQEMPMNPDGKLFLFTVPSLLPHAITNKGKDTATILEFADALQTEVTPIQVAGAMPNKLT